MALAASGRHGNIVKSTGDDSWILLQQKAFLAWVNQHLAPLNIHMKDLVQELKDGVNICHLMERLSNSKLEWSKKPKSTFESLENVNIALKRMRAQSVKLLAIGAEDLVTAPNQKLILGLIWVLILRYHLSGASDAKGQMIRWVKDRVSGMGLDCRDFSAASWGDGRVYVGLVHSIRPVPGVSDPAQIAGDPLEHVRKAMEFAESDLNVPHILDPEDIINPEELSMLTYLGFLKNTSEAQKSDAPPAIDVEATGAGLTHAIVGKPATFTLSVQITAPKTTPPAAASAAQLRPDLAAAAEAAFKATDKDGSGSVSQEELVAVLEKLLEGRVAADKVEKIALGQLLTITGDKDAALHQAEFTSVFASLQENFPPAEQLEKAIKDLAASPAPPPTRTLSRSTSMRSSSRTDTVNLETQGFKIGIEPPSGPPLTATATPTATPQVFTVAYEPRVTGKHQIMLSYKGDKVKAWTAEAVEGGADPAKCLAEGDGLQNALVGLPAKFCVHLRDADDAPIEKPRDVLTVLVAGSAPASITARDGAMGVFDVAYVAAEEEAVPIEVKVGGTAIKGSPFSVQVKRVSAVLTATKEIGVAGKPFSFVVQTKDAAGRSLSSVLRVSVNDESTQPISENIAEGSYSYSFVAPTDASRLRIEASLAGSNIDGSPFECAVVSAQHSRLHRPAESAQLRVGSSAAMWIELCDAKGDAAPLGALTALSVRVNDERVGDLKEPRAGRIEFNVPLAKSGDCIINADLEGGVSLQGSPCVLHVLTALSAKHSNFRVDGPAIVNSAVKIQVMACDADGKSVDAKQDRCIVKTDPQKELQVEYKGEGLFEASIVPTSRAPLRLYASLNGEAVPPEPLEITPRSSASAAHSRAEGEGLSAAEQNRRATFQVFVCDANDKQLTYGGDELIAWLVPSGGGDNRKVTVEVVDKANGTYDASYELPDGGAWSLHVQLNGEAIKGSPLDVTSTPMADPSHCRAFGSGLASATVGQRASFSVELRDRSKNPVNIPPFINAGNADVKVVPLGDGHFDVSYQPTAEGDLQVRVEVNKEHEQIHSSPFTVPVQAATKRVRTWTLFVSCTDDHGTLRSASEVDVKVTDPTGKPVHADVTTEEGGSVRLVIEPRVEGSYIVRVTVGGEDVTGSPFACEHKK